MEPKTQNITTVPTTTFFHDETDNDVFCRDVARYVSTDVSSATMRFIFGRFIGNGVTPWYRDAMV